MKQISEKLIQKLLLVFKPNIPLRHLADTLDAIEFLYSMGVLREYEWNKEAASIEPNWPTLTVRQPCHLLCDDHLLMFDGFESRSVRCACSGIRPGILLLINAVKHASRYAGARTATPATFEFVRTELGPIVDRLEQVDGGNELAKQLLQRAHASICELAIAVPCEYLRIGYETDRHVGNGAASVSGK